VAVLLASDELFHNIAIFQFDDPLALIRQNENVNTLG
jgi:hypothetical protein